MARHGELNLRPAGIDIFPCKEERLVRDAAQPAIASNCMEKSALWRGARVPTFMVFRPLKGGIGTKESVTLERVLSPGFTTWTVKSRLTVSPAELYPVKVCVTMTGGAGAVSLAKTFCRRASEKISPKTEALSLNMAFPLPTGNKWALRKRDVGNVDNR